MMGAKVQPKECTAWAVYSSKTGELIKVYGADIPRCTVEVFVRPGERIIRVKVEVLPEKKDDR